MTRGQSPAPERAALQGGRSGFADMPARTPSVRFEKDAA